MTFSLSVNFYFKNYTNLLYDNNFFSYSLGNSIIELYFSSFVITIDESYAKMEKCKFAFNVQYYLDGNRFVTVAFSFNKAKILTVIARGNSSFNSESKKDRGETEAENGEDRTAGIGYIFRSGAKPASHRNRVSEERVVFFHPSQH